MASCVDEPRRVTSFSNDEFVNDVFDFGVILANDGNKVNTVTKEIFDQRVKRRLVPMRTMKNNASRECHR